MNNEAWFFNGCNISISPIISKSIFAEQEEEEDNLILIYSDLQLMFLLGESRPNPINFSRELFEAISIRQQQLSAIGKKSKNICGYLL